MEGVKDAIKNIDQASDKMDEMADSAQQLGERLEKMGDRLQRGAQLVMGISDTVEGSSRLIQQYGTHLGLTEEQIEDLNQKTEAFVETMTSIQYVLMGVGDIMEITGMAMQFFRASHAVTTASTVAGNQAMSVSFLGLQISMGPLILVILAIAAAVAILFFAWKNNWGGIQITFENVKNAIQPAIEIIRRILQKLGFDVEGVGGLVELFGEIMDIVFLHILAVVEPVLLKLIDYLIIFLEWVEKAIDAWNAWRGKQKDMSTGGYGGAAVGSGGGYTYSPTQANTTIYGGVHNHPGEQSATGEGYNPFQISREARRGAY